MLHPYEKEKVEGAVREWQEEKRDKLFDLVLHYFENGLWYETSRWFIRGYDQEDLVQIGCLAVLRAMSDWIERKGTSFKTHAWNYIRRDLQDLKSVSAIRESKISEQIWDTEILGDLLEDDGDEIADAMCKYEIERLPLTDRERVVLEGLLRGREKQEIAEKLGLSPMAISWVVKDLRGNEELKELLCR
jgi:RNA polymerase sigma factor (sigma-70 family)